MKGDMVFDACAIAKLLFVENGSAQAHALAKQAERILTSELAFAEVANVALKKLRRGEVSKEVIASVIIDCKALIDEHTPVVDLAEMAFALSLTAMVSIYDASYASLAMKNQAPLVTSDAALSRALAGVAGAPRIILLPS
jgi:predicted nucleic acid-binding protein